MNRSALPKHELTDRVGISMKERRNERFVADHRSSSEKSIDVIFDFQKKGLLVRRTDRNERFGQNALFFIVHLRRTTVSRGTPDSFVEKPIK